MTGPNDTKLVAERDAYKLQVGQLKVKLAVIVANLEILWHEVEYEHERHIQNIIDIANEAIKE